MSDARGLIWIRIVPRIMLTSIPHWTVQIKLTRTRCSSLVLMQHMPATGCRPVLVVDLCGRTLPCRSAAVLFYDSGDTMVTIFGSFGFFVQSISPMVPVTIACAQAVWHKMSGTFWTVCGHEYSEYHPAH